MSFFLLPLANLPHFMCHCVASPTSTNGAYKKLDHSAGGKGGGRERERERGRGRSKAEQGPSCNYSYMAKAPQAVPPAKLCYAKFQSQTTFPRPTSPLR